MCRILILKEPPDMATIAGTGAFDIAGKIKP